jgi:hypothetical protein
MEDDLGSSPSLHLRSETNPTSETLCSDRHMRRRAESRKPATVHQGPLEPKKDEDNDNSISSVYIV